jgi:hypothetical protein
MTLAEQYRRCRAALESIAAKRWPVGDGVAAVAAAHDMVELARETLCASPVGLETEQAAMLVEEFAAARIAKVVGGPGGYEERKDRHDKALAALLNALRATPASQAPAPQDYVTVRLKVVGRWTCQRAVDDDADAPACGADLVIVESLNRGAEYFLNPDGTEHAHLPVPTFDEVKAHAVYEAAFSQAPAPSVPLSEPEDWCAASTGAWPNEMRCEQKAGHRGPHTRHDGRSSTAWIASDDEETLLDAFERVVHQAATSRLMEDSAVKREAYAQRRTETRGALLAALRGSRTPSSTGEEPETFYEGPEAATL